MKTLQKTLAITTLLFLFSLFSCSKDNNNSTDVKSRIVGNWSGSLQYDGFTNLYPFNMIMYSDNTFKNIDIAFNNEEFLGTYTYTNDSIKINYNNGTKWKLKFSNNYSSCSGTFLGYNGDPGTVTMSKN